MKVKISYDSYVALPPTWAVAILCRIRKLFHLAYVNSGKYAQLLQNKWLTYMVMHIYMLIVCL